jgi:hypothetical protein
LLSSLTIGIAFIWNRYAGYTALIALPIVLGILLWLMRQAELAAVRGSS